MAALGNRPRGRLKRVAHDFPNQRSAGIELVQQLDPCGHHRIQAEAFTFLGANLVGAAEVA